MSSASPWYAFFAASALPPLFETRLHRIKEVEQRESNPVGKAVHAPELFRE